MKNRLLAVTRHQIPYIKELRPFAGSVAGCIVMQQLDFWFDRHPDGFFKFLSPCQHPSFRPGRSWTEELGMSTAEFRTAFDHIGIRYKSKSQYNAEAHKFHTIIIEDKQEKRVERYYCSYFDKIKGLTYYRRNDALVDDLLEALCRKLPPSTSVNEGAESTGDAQAESRSDARSSSTEVKKLNPGSVNNPREELKDINDPSRAAQVRAVFQFWQEHLCHPKAVLDGKRERAIEMRLKHGFTADDLMLAIRGCKATPYNMGENKEQRVYDDIELICRDAKHVEEFITAAAPRGGASGTDAESDDERRRREECQHCLGTGMRLKGGKAIGRCNHE